MSSFLRLSSLLMLFAVPLAQAGDVPKVRPYASSPSMPSYNDAPGTPDADDPAIWQHPRSSVDSLVIGTLKDAGLLVMNLSAQVVQTLPPPNLPAISSDAPPTPAGLNSDDRPCAESASGETYGRYNNVEVTYGFALSGAGGRRTDLAVVTDRGCDRLRFYAIDAANRSAPLHDITANSAPRVFPRRFIQPSPFQPGAPAPGPRSNPLDKQNTAYGLTLWRDADKLYAFVTQRERSVVEQVQIVPTADGRVSYEHVRTFVFLNTFVLPSSENVHDVVLWTPCRADPDEEPQSEGLVVDPSYRTLYAAFETIGVYKVALTANLPDVVAVGQDALLEPALHFGLPYRAVGGDDEYTCVYAGDDNVDGPAIEVAGTFTAAGSRLQADVEGLALYTADPMSGYLLVSSQGDDTFHLFDRRRPSRYVGAFAIAGVGETDGVALVTGRNGTGLLVAQNGKAPQEDAADEVNGYAYDNATQFVMVAWRSIARALQLP